MTPDGATNTVASILFDGPTLTAKVDELEKQIAELQQQNQYYKSSVQAARSLYAQLRGVLTQLYDNCTDQSLPDHPDLDAMYDRLKTLFEADSDHEVWNLKREYDVTITYVLTVTGRVTARSADDAKDTIRNNELRFRFDDEGDVEDADLSWDVDEIQVEEA